MKKIIKSSKNPIRGAEEKPSEAFEDQLKTIEDDFEYAIDGLNKLARSGATTLQQAQVIAEKLQASIQSVVNDIAESISE